MGFLTGAVVVFAGRGVVDFALGSFIGFVAGPVVNFSAGLVVEFAAGPVVGCATGIVVDFVVVVPFFDRKVVVSTVDVNHWVVSVASSVVVVVVVVISEVVLNSVVVGKIVVGNSVVSSTDGGVKLSGSFISTGKERTANLSLCSSLILKRCDNKVAKQVFDSDSIQVKKRYRL